MPRAICRCGQTLKLPGGPAGPESERVVCPSCGARVRVRRSTAIPPGAAGQAGAGAAPAPAVVGDGFIRFACGCGKRLKVPAANPPTHGQCPDCGAVVPVPRASSGGLSLPPGHPETPTAEIDRADLEALEQWARDHIDRAPDVQADEPTSTALPSAYVPAPAYPPQDLEETPLHEPTRPGSNRPQIAEVGLRVCPNCSRPVHLGSDTCRSCGTRVPRR